MISRFFAIMMNLTFFYTILFAAITLVPREIPGFYLETQFQKAGLVDLQKLDSTLLVKLAYGTSDNFLHRDVYHGFQKAYLQPEVAQRVVRAQAYLQRIRPGYRLLILDAARPLSVQRAMYDLVRGTPERIYVADGKRGGRHNYGAAVDVTIVDEKGVPLDMGTPFDYFGEAAHLDGHEELLENGTLSFNAVRNRELLVRVMREGGLVPYIREWWHYQEPISMEKVRLQYSLLDF